MRKYNSAIALSMQMSHLGRSAICCHTQIGYKVIQQWSAACETGFAVCLCPGCKCWLITKPHILCRSAIHCCSSDWQEKKEEYRYVRLTQILQGGLYLEIKLGLTDEEEKIYGKHWFQPWIIQLRLDHYDQDITINHPRSSVTFWNNRQCNNLKAH